MGSDPRLPNDKHDHAAVARAEAAEPDDIVPILPDLLEWSQDRNWPIYPAVVAVLRRFGARLGPHVAAALRSEDDDWKQNIMADIAPAFAPTDWTPFLDDALRIALQPTEGERRDHADIAAQSALSVYFRALADGNGR